MGDYNTFLDEVAEELSRLAFSSAVAPPPDGDFRNYSGI